MLSQLDFMLSRCGRADLMTLNQFTMGVGAQTLFFLAILPRSEFRLSQTLSLGSTIAAIFGYLFSMLSKDLQLNPEWEEDIEHEGKTMQLPSKQYLDLERSVKVAGLAISMVAIALLLVGIASFPECRVEQG
ncbi:hypothetical protein M407DRAFT_125602 [Tulasnella calospora MUT 4182]|uniref:Uncharacterized protein n=1 Tax=Tulasnella calospora MUT 4182 TaxID=1051891 RepID=A0A0C3LJG2_9AGAM|nr:hypothetical protein M407DRAFT_125602 [Tulasnella calospora MUT 4182]